MAISLNNRAISALVKINTTGMKHSERLHLFATTLGFRNAAAMMSAARDQADIPAAASAPERARVLPEGRLITASAPQTSGGLPGDPIIANIYPGPSEEALEIDIRLWLMTLSPEGYREFILWPLAAGNDILRYHFRQDPGILSLIPDEEPLMFVDMEEVIRFCAPHCPKAHNVLHDMLREGDIDADLGAMAGDQMAESWSVHVAVSRIASKDRIDHEDHDADGNDVIEGIYRYEVVADGPVSDSYAWECALKEFRNRYGMANLDNYQIRPSFRNSVDGIAVTASDTLRIKVPAITTNEASSAPEPS